MQRRSDDRRQSLDKIHGRQRLSEELWMGVQRAAMWIAAACIVGAVGGAIMGLSELEARRTSALESASTEPPPPGEPGVAQTAKPAGAAATTLTGVTSEEREGSLVLVLSANGRLPSLSIKEAAQAPYRLYLDIPGVTPRVPAVVPLSKGPVRRVRVAVNSLQPLVTRVVIDLTERMAYVLEPLEGDGTRLRILIGRRDTKQTTTTAPVPAPQAPAQAPAEAPPPAKTEAPRTPTAAASAGTGAASGRPPVSVDRAADTRVPDRLPLLIASELAMPSAKSRRAQSTSDRAATAKAQLAQAVDQFAEGQFEAAERSAARAREAQPSSEGALIIARCALERFRKSADAATLDEGLAALRGLDGETLTPRGRVDLIAGLAMGLYMSGEFRAAADLFSTVFDRAGSFDPAMRDSLLDWWATSLARHAQSQPAGDRVTLYEQIRTAMVDEVRRDPGSIAASYWSVAALRGAGELDRAWDAAVAGWVRAQLCRDGGAALRHALDRLMADNIIPERAQRLAGGTSTPEQVQILLGAEWQSLKDKWTNR